MEKKVLMLVNNTFQNDARVERTIHTLKENGCRVHLVATQHKELPQHEDADGFKITRIQINGKQVGALPWYAKLILKLLHQLSKRTDQVISLAALQKKSICDKFLLGYSKKILFRLFHVKVQRNRYFQFHEKFKEIATTFEPHFIYAHDFPCLIAAGLIHKELNIPYVYDSHELWSERNRLLKKPFFHDKKWELKTEADFIKNASATITVCDSIADYLRNKFSINRPHVVRNIPYRSPITQKSLREIFSLKQSDFLTLYIGKATFNRGILDILAALPQTPPHVKFLCLGYFDPRFKKVFDKLVKKYQLNDRVFTFGPVNTNDVVNWASDGDLSLTTMSQSCLSYLYTLPNKLFESIQAGLPIIGPNSPEVIKIVDTYQCGMIYQDGDSLDLANKMIELTHSPQKLASMKENAKIAAEILCWQNEKNALLEACKIVL